MCVAFRLAPESPPLAEIIQNEPIWTCIPLFAKYFYPYICLRIRGKQRRSATFRRNVCALSALFLFGVYGVKSSAIKWQEVCTCPLCMMRRGSHGKTYSSFKIINIMKERTLIVSCLLCAASMLSAQTADGTPCPRNDMQRQDSVRPSQADAEGDTPVYNKTTENPKFPGGEEACMKWLADNMQYPASCAEQGIQGRVYAQFVVETDGSLSHIKIIRSPDAALSKETERLLKSMPKWSPGKQDGVPVRTTFSLPVIFRLK